MMGFVVGIAMITASTAENGLLLFGLIFILIPWINLLALRRSVCLYKDLIKN
jgi:hypothetical protein